MSLIFFIVGIYIVTTRYEIKSKIIFHLINLLIYLFTIKKLILYEKNPF